MRLAVSQLLLFALLWLRWTSGMELQHNDCAALVSSHPSLFGQLGLTDCPRPSQTLCSNCNLTAVLKTDGAGRVIELKLTQRDLAGMQLPSVWSSLVALTSLNISSSNVTGDVPETWSVLTNLVSLDLAYNALVAPIPAEVVASLRQLQTLDLQATNITGTLPGSWSQLTALQSLSLRRNDGLIGPLPTAWGTLPSLILLDLRGCAFNGSLPDSWSQLKTLQYLGTRNNKLTGPLPSSWSALQNLKQLNASDCSLTGTLPAIWSVLSQLQRLDVGRNKLKGTYPESWSTLSQMTMLFLRNSNFFGTLPAQWSTMQKLVEISVANTNISGPLPTEWSAMQSLTYISFTKASVSGPIPASWHRLSNLLMLLVDNNHLTGTIPSPLLTSAANLRFVDLSGNNLTGPIPANISPTLTMLLLDHNRLSGTIPLLPKSMAMFRAANNTLTGHIPVLPTSMLLFGAPSNNLTGPLPSLPANLTVFDVSRNNLEGPIANLPKRLILLDVMHNNMDALDWSPAELRNLTYMSVANNRFDTYLPAQPPPQLQYANFSGSRFQGSVPAAWLRQDWNILDLSHNELGGALPTDISGNISVLVLKNNALQGELPTALLANTSLVVLDVRTNRIKGPFPADWAAKGNFGELRYMGLAENVFDGGVPLAWMRSNETFYGVKMMFGRDVWYRYKERGWFARGLGWMKGVCTNRGYYSKLMAIAKQEIDPQAVLSPVKQTLMPVVARLVADLYNSLAKEQTGFERRTTAFFQDRVENWIDLPAWYFDQLNENTQVELDVDRLCNNDEAVDIVMWTWLVMVLSVMVSFLAYKLLKAYKEEAMEQAARSWFLRCVRWVMRMKQDSSQSKWMEVAIFVGHVASAVLYWADIVTDILVIKDVWGSWPGYIFLGVLLTQYTYTAFVLSFIVMAQHDARIRWWPLVTVSLVPAVPVLDTIARVIVGGVNLPFVGEFVDWHQYSLFREIVETALEAFPSAALQSVVFVLGNSPNSKLYIDKYKFIPSIVVSAAVIIKAAGKLMWTCLDESHRHNLLGFLLHTCTARNICYKRPEVNLKSFKLQYPAKVGTRAQGHEHTSAASTAVCELKHSRPMASLEGQEERA